MGMRELLMKHAAKQGQGLSWMQGVDLVCSMLCITDRHIIIDSARAIVHLSWVQLGKSHVLDVAFNDIVAAVNKPLGAHSVPERVNHIGPATINIGTAVPIKPASATSPP
jgi:hypothetical protein